MKKFISSIILIVTMTIPFAGSILAASPDETIYAPGYYKQIDHAMNCQANFGYPTASSSIISGYTNSVASGNYTVVLNTNAYPTANDLISKSNCKYSYSYVEYDGSVSMYYSVTTRVKALNNTHSLYNSNSKKYNVYLFDI